MKAKLKKVGETYNLYIVGQALPSISNACYPWEIIKPRLSLENCKKIEKGNDLDEMAEEWVFEKNGHKWSNNDNSAGDNFGSFKAGAKAMLEIIGDKKFNEEQLWKMFLYGHALKNAIKSKTIENKPMGEIFNDFIKITHSDEWDVEVEMDHIGIGDKYTPDPELKLDSEGCLILKKK
jgi:hypothetical protein